MIIYRTGYWSGDAHIECAFYWLSFPTNNKSLSCRCPSSVRMSLHVQIPALAADMHLIGKTAQLPCWYSTKKNKSSIPPGSSVQLLPQLENQPLLNPLSDGPFPCVAGTYPSQTRIVRAGM